MGIWSRIQAARSVTFTDDEWASLALLRERARTAALLTAFSDYKVEVAPGDPFVSRVRFMRWRYLQGRLTEYPPRQRRAA